MIATRLITKTALPFAYPHYCRQRYIHPSPLGLRLSSGDEKEKKRLQCDASALVQRPANVAMWLVLVTSISHTLQQSKKTKAKGPPRSMSGWIYCGNSMQSIDARLILETSH